MGVIANIRAVLSGRVRRTYYVGGATTVDIDGLSAADLYESQPALRTVVDFLARNIAELPLKVYREGDGGRERDRTSSLATLLADPNPDMTSYELVRDLVSDLKLYGYALWLVGMDSESASGWQIRPIPPSWVDSWEGGGFSPDTVTFVNRLSSGDRVTVGRDSFVLFHSYKPGDPRSGSSAVRALKETIREQVAAQGYRRDVWERGIRISGYLSKPEAVRRWEPEKRNRFLTQLKSAWSKDGENSGGTPLFEDGIEYHPVEFNAKEKDWASGVKLSREEVAATYHVNPKLIWSGDGQTYASAKDNARALYADTLAPDLAFISKRITKELSRIVGAEPGTYAEFDLQAKLQGSFEEQASSLQTAVGGPWMTRKEARVRMNLPEIEGCDELIVPLNVVTGGLASPNDTDPTEERYNAAEHPAKCGCKAHADAAPRHKAAPTDEEQKDYADALRSFFGRQRRSVLAAMGDGAKARKEGVEPWWDSDRWDSELADDLYPLITAASEEEARRTLMELGLDPDAYDPERTDAFLKSVAESRARMVNDSTLRELQRGDKPAEVFDRAEQSRSDQLGRTLATAVAAWSACEAARQCAPRRTTKTWVTGQNPRQSHAAMNGDTVAVSAKFSNGADWPGDSRALDAADVANCNCTVEITIPD